MQELGIVMQVIRQVEQVTRENQVSRVLKLNVEVGEDLARIISFDESNM